MLEWLAYLKVDDHAFRRWSALGALLWAGQYACLGAWTAALTMGSTALRTAWSGRALGARVRVLVSVAFVAGFSVLTVMSWQGSVSLLPWFATVNTTLALFLLARRSLRIVLLPSSAAWIANDLIWQAWPALLAETVAVLLNLRTIRRLAADSAPT